MQSRERSEVVPAAVVGPQLPPSLRRADEHFVIEASFKLLLDLLAFAFWKTQVLQAYYRSVLQEQGLHLQPRCLETMRTQVPEEDVLALLPAGACACRVEQCEPLSLQG